MVSLGFIQGFMQGVLIRSSYQDFFGFLWASPRVFKVSFRIQTGENKAKEKGSKDRKQRSRGAGRRAAKTHDSRKENVEQQKQKGTEAQKQKSREAGKAVKQKRKEAGKAQKQKSREAGKAEKQKSRKAQNQEPKKNSKTCQKKTKTKINSPPRKNIQSGALRSGCSFHAGCTIRQYGCISNSKLQEGPFKTAARMDQLLQDGPKSVWGALDLINQGQQSNHQIQKRADKHPSSPSISWHLGWINLFSAFLRSPSGMDFPSYRLRAGPIRQVLQVRLPSQSNQWFHMFTVLSFRCPESYKHIVCMCVQCMYIYIHMHIYICIYNHIYTQQHI